MNMAFYAFKKIAETRDVEQTAGGVAPGGFEQDMIGLMAAEHIVDQVGGDGDLAAALFFAGVAAFDQARR